MKGKGKDKLLAGIGTVWFMSLIATNAQPKLWQSAFLALGLYEVMQMTIRIARKQAYKERERHYITVDQKNRENLNKHWIGDDWEMMEVQ